MTINRGEIYPQLRREIADIPGGEYIKRCYACGACSGICPISRIIPGFDPRKIIRMAILGLRERLLSSDLIWDCARCQNCSFVCPQDVRFSDVIGALRELAIKSGLVDVATLESTGKLAVVDQTKCVGCLTCVRVCPFNAACIEERGVASIDLAKCRSCGICVAECPARAINLKEHGEEKGIAGCSVPDARTI